MPNPDVFVEVAFTGGPFDVPQWTDVTRWVEGFRTSRGRSYELDRIEAGTLTLQLDNSDGRFTPGRQVTGTNLVTQGLQSVSLAGRGDNTQIYATRVNNIVAGSTYVATTRFATVGSGLAVNCYYAFKWFDSVGATLRFTIGTRFQAEATPFVVSHSEDAPAGAVSMDITVWADTYPNGNTGLTFTADTQRFYAQAPYYPNVVPRRQVRVRTANLLPRDVSTGGDLTRSAGAFQTSHSTNTSGVWSTTLPKSGAGSLRVTWGSNGTSDYASSVRIGLAPGPSSPTFQMAPVTSGVTYIARAEVQLASGSPAASLILRTRFYDANGAFISNGANSATISAVEGQWRTLTIPAAPAPANAAWLGLTVGSKGGDNGASFYLDEIQVEANTAVSAWAPGGNIFTGLIERWPVRTEGLTAEVEVSAVDGFSALGNIELRSPLESYILTTNPLGYWPLTDGPNTTRLANLARDADPAFLVKSKYGGATSALGAPSVVPNDTGTSYNLTNVAADKGTVVDINDGGKRRYFVSGGMSLAFWCLPTRPSSGTFVTLWRSWTADAAARHTEIRMDSTGAVTASAYFSDGVSSVTSSPLSTSVPSFLAISVSDRDLTLYVNGVAVGTGVVSANPGFRDMGQSSLAGAQGVSVQSGVTAWQEYASGRFGHLVLWDRTAKAAEILEVWQFGYYDGAPFVADAHIRLADILDMADWAAGRAIDTDTGTTLQAPNWERGTHALDELQQAASDAGGYVFMDGSGTFTYHARARRQSAPVRFTLSDTAGTPYEAGLEFDIDEDKVINEVAYSSPDGSDGVVRDDASIALYGRKSATLEKRLAFGDDVLYAAQALLATYAAPGVRCDRVTLNPTAVNALFPVVLGLEIGDRITLADMPDSAPASSADYFVEAIDFDVSAIGANVQWTVSLSLSPAEDADVWILDVGHLDDDSSLLAY